MNRHLEDGPIKVFPWIKFRVFPRAYKSAMQKSGYKQWFGRRIGERWDREVMEKTKMHPSSRRSPGGGKLTVIGEYTFVHEGHVLKHAL